MSIFIGDKVYEKELMDKSIDSIKTKMSDFENLNQTKIQQNKEYSLSRSQIEIIDMIPDNDT